MLRGLLVSDRQPLCVQQLTHHIRLIAIYVGFVAAMRCDSNRLLVHARQHLLSSLPLINMHFNRDMDFNEQDQATLLGDANLKLFSTESKGDRLMIKVDLVANGTKERVILDRAP